MKRNNNNQFSQRQLRVGEMIKQSLGQIFIRGEAKIPTLETNNITVTEVRMSPDLKSARVYVIPLGGKDSDKTVDLLTDFSHLVRKALSKKLDIKFLPRISFVGDKPFDYAEKIDFYSNGFKARTTNDGTNESSGTYIYMAFAEAPLVGSNNIPCTAR